MAIAFTYTESTNTVVVTGGTSGTPATFADFVFADRTVKTTAASGGSGCVLKAATTVTGASQVVTLTYPMRPVEYKALYLSVSVSQGVGNALSGGEQFTVDGTTAIWVPIPGASASGQTVVPCVDTHLFQVGQTVILIDISAPGTWETDVVASISEGVSITLTNNNTNSYAIGDILGIYQYETIPVGAFATFTTSYAYGQIATITYQGFDNNTTTVEQPIWGVIWNNGGNQYRVDAIFKVGNGSTSTYFLSKHDQVYFADNSYVRVYLSATLTLGELTNSWPTYGTCWDVGYTVGAYYFVADGTVNIYGSSYHNRTSQMPQFYSGALTIVRSILSNTFTLDSGLNRKFTCPGTVTSSYQSVYFMNVAMISWASVAPTLCDDVHVHGSTGSLGMTLSNSGGTNTVTVTGGRVTNCTKDYATQYGGTNTLYVIDSKAAVGTVQIESATSTIYEQYTCNINVCDKAGAAISGATVDCVDTTATAVWAAGTVTTDASGNITQQTITYKSWAGTSETLTSYSPHKFTISKAGYITLVLDNITVSSAIKWHLELQNNLDNNFSKMARINTR